MLIDEQGVRRTEEELRSNECRACVEAREAQMSQMRMSDFNVRRLGWRTYERKGSDGGEEGGKHEVDPADSDGGYGYCW